MVACKTRQQTENVKKELPVWVFNGISFCRKNSSVCKTRQQTVKKELPVRVFNNIVVGLVSSENMPDTFMMFGVISIEVRFVLLNHDHPPS